MRIFDIHRYRPIAVLVLMNQLACYAWTRQPAPIAPLLGRHPPKAIRLHRPDGTVTEIGAAHIKDDSVVGTWKAGWGPERRRAVVDTALAVAAVRLTDGATMTLLQPIVRHDSLVGYVGGWESRPAGVAVGRIAVARLRLTDGDRVRLRSVALAGDSLVGLAGRVGRPRPGERVRVAVAVTETSWSEVHGRTEVGQGLLYGTLCIVGLVAAGLIWCGSNSECLRY